MSNFRNWFFKEGWPEGDQPWNLLRYKFKTKWGTEYEETELFEHDPEAEPKDYSKWILDNFGAIMHKTTTVHISLYDYVWNWGKPTLENDDKTS